jgi:membrane protease subunit HflK
MAWNQPNGGQQNPWGRRPGQGTDIDERLKSLQKRLESLLRFGGSGEGGGGSLAVILGLVVLLVWIFTGFYQVKQAESAVVQRFGALVAVKPAGAGLNWHWPWPIETVTKVNVGKVNSSAFNSRVLTSDINLADLRFLGAVPARRPDQGALQHARPRADPERGERERDPRDGRPQHPR